MTHRLFRSTALVRAARKLVNARSSSRLSVWLRTDEGSQRWPWPEEFHELREPVDWRLKGTSSWVNFWTGKDEILSGCAHEPHTALEIADTHD